MYTKKTFEKLTGVKDYESNNGSIYINPADYNTLFGKGNYQATVYVKELKELEGTKDALQTMGFTTLSLKDAMVNYVDDVVSIIQVPIAVLIIIALFFIAYFVIRLILRSRVSYFQYPADAGAGTEEYQKDTGRGNVYGDQYRVYDFPGSSGPCEHGDDPCGICQDAGGISPGDGLCDPVCDPHRNGISHIRKVCKKPV